MDRRRFMTSIVAGAGTLTVAGRFASGTPAGAQLGGLLPDLPGLPDGLLPEGGGLPGTAVSDFYDLGDALVQVAAPTMALLTLEITESGGARFRLPRMEVGQGIDTTVAMMIAEELGIGLDQVEVTLEDSRPELLFNQLTGGSYNVRALYQPVSRMAATARDAMVGEASTQLGVPVDQLVVRDGGVAAPGGGFIPYGSLSQATAALVRPLDSPAKPVAEHTVLGTPQIRQDALAIVTGRKQFAMDGEFVAGAVPTVAVHAPQIRGTLASFDNEEEIRGMPGVLHVATIRSVPTLGMGEAPSYGLTDAPTAIVIGAKTFGQALAAERAVQATWNPGTQAGRSDADMAEDLRAATLPISPDLGAIGATSVYGEFDFAPVAHAPMETMTAVADTTDSSCEVWSGLKIPIPAQQEIAEALGLPLSAVTCHVIPSGGSFGRRLFHETATEAALASRAFGVPVKLMWSRQEDTRGDRLRAPTHHKIRATHLAGQPVAFEHRMASGFTSFSHGLGDALSSIGAHNPLVQYGVAQTIFTLQLTQPYHLGLNTQLLNEVDFNINTGSWRSVYTGTARIAEEVIIDELAAALGRDPMEFRIATAKEAKLKRCLEWVRDNGGYGTPSSPTAVQGIAGNSEHRSNMAVLVEVEPADDDPYGLDGDPPPVRVTKAVMAFDANIVMNPLGLEAQLISGLNDGIATVLRASVHIADGAVQETAFSDFRYGRAVHHPTDVTVHIFDSDTTADVEPGGAGEISVPTTGGAVANAYARLTGQPIRSFPVNH